jgi:hypothetical protein
MGQYGFAALNQQLNANVNNGFNVANAISQANLIRAVRVLSIVLDETHPRFQELGAWNGLGIIEYEDVNNPLPSPSLPTARSLTGNFKNLPLINEIVYLIGLPNTEIEAISSNTVEYYINIVSLWNHPHHNAFPTAPNALPPTQQKDYIQTTGGNVRRVTDQSTEIYLGKTFIERSNIHPILPFEGDILYEGRWGNSIRIGSTVKNTINNWSSVGTNGDPIMILRNGQGVQTEEGWVPTVEDINNDDSSAYFTSTQKIPLKASSTSYFSYKSNPPQTPDQYAGKQIIINSGRLVFNSTVDHILLSSRKSINLNAVENVNIDSPNTTIQSENVYLGSKNATEPVLLGDSTISTLASILDNMIGFLNIAANTVSTAPGTPIVPLNVASNELASKLDVIKGNLEKLKSNTVKTV